MNTFISYIIFKIIFNNIILYLENRIKNNKKLKKMKSLFFILLLISISLSLKSKLNLKLSKQIQEDEYYYDDQQQDAESKDYYYDEEQQEEYSIYLPRNLPKYLKDLQPKQQNYEIDYNKDFNNYYKNHDEIYNERNFDEVQEIPEESYYGDYFDYFQFPEEGFYFYDDGQDQQNFYFEQQEIQ